MAGVLKPLGELPLKFCRPYNFYAVDYHPHQLKTLHIPRQCSHCTCLSVVHLNKLPPSSTLNYRHRLSPLAALNSDIPQPSQQRSESFEKWDSLSAKFAGAANIPFLSLQLPQIVLNAHNLLAGNNSALFAVPWLGMFTGLLGNLSLLSYFIKKKETEAAVVQTLGVVSTYVVITQLAMAGAMPLPHYIATSVVVFSGMVINFMNYFSMLNPAIWRSWEDFITIVGLSAVPQVMWSTFIPYVPNTILPGLVAFAVALVSVIMNGQSSVCCQSYPVVQISR